MMLVSAACTGDDEPGGAPATTIAITTDRLPLFLRVRDGDTGAWQEATSVGTGRYEAIVHGPYTVVTVCRLVDGSIQTLQRYQTPDDPHELDLHCVVSTATSSVTGHMVQAGNLSIGGLNLTSADPEWDFAVGVETGRRDVIASTADRVVVRHDVDITGTTALPVIDVAREGTAMVPVAFTVANLTSDERAQASVGLLTANSPNPAALYGGNAATAMVAPDAALIASDTQSVSVRAASGPIDGPIMSRSLRRPFRVGGDTVATVPEPIRGLAWAIEGDVLAASWASMPPMDDHFFLAGTHAIEMSTHYLADTQSTRVVFETELPGYRGEWKNDYAGDYQRLVLVQSGEELGVLASVLASEPVHAAR